MGRPSRYAPEVRERAVRMVFEHEPEYDSQGTVIRSIAGKIGCSAETLRHWVCQAERDAGRRPGLTTEERRRLKDLERENRELKRARTRFCARRRRISRRRSSTAVVRVFRSQQPPIIGAETNASPPHSLLTVSPLF